MPNTLPELFALLLLIGGVLIYQATHIPRHFKKGNDLQTNFISKINNHISDIVKISGVTTKEIILVILLKILLLMLSLYFLSCLFDLSKLQEFFIFLAGVGFIIRQELTRKIKAIVRYQRDVEYEFSSFAETLALAVNSGLSFTAAFVKSIHEFVGPLNDRIEISKKTAYIKRNLHPRAKRRRNKSPLQLELINILNEIQEMRTIPQILDKFSKRVNSQVISDFADAIILSLTRGTPISLMISEHARSIREKDHREMLERAGKAEIKMMMPIVFLLLPISVLFALWPSFQQLQHMVALS